MSTTNQEEEQQKSSAVTGVVIDQTGGGDGDDENEGIATGNSSNNDNNNNETDRSNNKQPINLKNWLNLGSYLLNIIFTFGVGTNGWFGNGTNGELSQKYQTLVTPKSDAFRIWIVIFLMQVIFVIVQFLPRFRAVPMVQQGVTYWYCAVSIFQVGWTFTFAYEVLWLSLLFMVLIWISLMGLLYSQYYAESDGTLWEFWLLRFPFALHGGWITAASVVNTNVIVVSSNASPAVELGIGIVSLAYLHAVSVWVLFTIKRNPNYTIAAVLAWAIGYVYAELQSPTASIEERFDETTIDGVALAAILVSVIITLQIVVRFVMYGLQKYNTKYAGAVKEAHREEKQEEAAATAEAADSNV